MKILMTIIVALFFLSLPGFAQSDIDFTQFSSLKQVEDDVQNFTDGLHAGLSALDWTDGSAPSLFRISAGVFTGFGSFDAAEQIGLKDGGVTLGNIGAQVGFGTAGVEVYARYFPEIDVSDVKLKTLGFGLKYELTSLVPVPLFPALSVYGDYNTLDFGVNATRTGTVPDAPMVQYETKAGIDMSFSTINIGLIASKSFLLFSIYGKVAYELGSTDITWNSVTSSNVPAGYVTVEENAEFDNNGFRYGVGLTLMGIRAEVGGRGSNLFLGLGYGISI
jgi:hypothetical protein